MDTPWNHILYIRSLQAYFSVSLRHTGMYSDLTGETVVQGLVLGLA